MSHEIDEIELLATIKSIIQHDVNAIGKSGKRDSLDPQAALKLVSYAKVLLQIDKHFRTVDPEDDRFEHELELAREQIKNLQTEPHSVLFTGNNNNGSDE